MLKFLQKLNKFIRLVIYDYYNPVVERPFGISCYVGLPGSGKTLSLVHELDRRKRKFPNAKIYTNFGYNRQDGAVENWQQLIDIENGEDGVIFGIDEVHSIFGRNDWRNMPSGILMVFSQNRKFAKEFICTAQAYEDIVIDMRRRCNWIVECKTFMKRWVFQRAFSSVMYSIKDDLKTKSRKAWKYNFIADEQVYNAYDTYAIIENIRSGAEKALPEEELIESPVKFIKTKIQ